MMQSRHAPSLNATKNEYFVWLCEMVHIDSHECWNLAKDLHSMEFTYILPLDENRAMDGLSLREDFFRDNPNMNYGYLDYMDEPCSVLEMLIALAERIAFELDDPYDEKDSTSDFFWEMLHNLEIDEFTDDIYYRDNVGYVVVDSIERFVERDYESDGTGGLFPIKYGVNDQRDMEIWCQMQEYIEENYPSYDI